MALRPFDIYVNVNQAQAMAQALQLRSDQPGLDHAGRGAGGVSDLPA